jgi:hypothetical protein
LSVALAPGADMPGLEIRLDGTALNRGLWDVLAPVDSGSHVLAASAPGFRTWTSTFEVEPGAGKKITVPVLDVELTQVSGPTTRAAASVDVAPPLAVPKPPAASVDVAPPVVPPKPVASSVASAPPSGPAARTWIAGRFWVDATTVQDVKTALTWQRNVIPRGAVWNAASAYCGALRVQGGGWRLPTPEELASIILPSSAPAIDTQAFPQTPAGWFWTASNHTWGTAEATSFVTGARQPVMNDRPLYVRCVR